MGYWTDNSGVNYYQDDNLGGTLRGLAGNDFIYGNGGDDIINGGAGNDHMEGGTGNDQFQYGVIDPGGLGTGFDYIDGGDGWDIITLSGSTSYLWTACGLTHLSNVEEIINTSGTQPGYILVNGTVDFSGVERMTGVTSITGQSGNDVITGSSWDYYGTGNYIADNILGGAGNDKLDGGAGANSLTGGAGNDIFQVSQNHDQSTIFDFTGGSDEIHLPTTYTDIVVANDALGYAHITSASHDVDITVVGVDSSALTLSTVGSEFVYA